MKTPGNIINANSKPLILMTIPTIILSFIGESSCASDLGQKPYQKTVSAISEFKKRVDTTATQSDETSGRLKDLYRNVSEDPNKTLALLVFNRLIEKDPKDELAYFHRACVYGAIGQYERALADYDQTISLDCLNQERYAKNRLGFIDKARVVAHAFDPDWCGGLGDSGYIGYVFETIAEGANFRISFIKQRAQKLGSADAELNNTCKQAILTAIDSYTKLIGKLPKEDKPYLRRAELYTTLGQYDNAINDYIEAGCVAHNGMQSYDYGRIRDLCQKSGKPERYLLCCSDIIKRKPENYEAYIERALAYEASEQFDKTIADYKHALALYKFGDFYCRDRCLTGLEKLYDKIGKPEKIIDEYDDLIKRFPQDPVLKTMRDQKLQKLEQGNKPATN